MSAREWSETRAFAEAMTALEQAKAAFLMLIMDARAERLSRLVAGRPDFVQVVEPLHDLNSGLAVVEELEKMLKDVHDAPINLQQAVIEKIAVTLAGLNAARADLKH